MTDYESLEQRLHDEIVAFTKYIQPIPEEQAARQQVYELVCKILRQRFQKCHILLYGSVAQELSLLHSDIDIIVHTKVESANLKNCLFDLSRRVRDSGIAKDVHVRHRAKVPIISFQTTPAFASLHFDISLNNSGHCAVPVVKRYIDSMPALKPLMLVVKCFLRQHKLNDASLGGLSSYAILCMVISMLQLNPFVRPWAMITAPMQSESLGILLMDLFSYYGTSFPYSTSYISISQCKLIPKEKLDARLSIRCALNPDLDITKSLCKLDQITAAFREGYIALKNISFSMHRSNYLGAILGVTQETIAQREHIQNTVNSGILLSSIQASRAQKTCAPPERSRTRPRTHQYLSKDPRPLVSYESLYPECESSYGEPASKRQCL